MWTLINREFNSLRLNIYGITVLTAICIFAIMAAVWQSYDVFSSSISQSPPIGISGKNLMIFMLFSGI